MTLKIDDEWPEKLLRGWATSYRETPEYRFPSDPSAEFFPVDMEAAADEIERLRAIETAARVTCDEIASYVGPLAQDYSALLKEVQQLRIFVGFVESVVSNPIGAYSVSALDGIFGMMRDKIAALPK